MKKSSSGLIVIPLLRKFNDKEIQEINEELSQKIFVLEKEKLDILCRVCRSSITTADDMIDILGSHFHTFKNPAGIVFRIRCFSSATGCTLLGQPTEEFTWFPGYRWNFALCSNCFAHLGWHFQTEGHRFFGLIHDNIVESSSIH